MGKYGEPFEIEKVGEKYIIYGQPSELEAKSGTKRIWVTDARDYGPRRLDRLVACANACEGMDDPAAEIAMLREENAEMKRELLGTDLREDQ